MIQVTIDQESKNRIKKALAELDVKDANSALNRGVLKASTYVLSILKTNVTGGILNVRTGNLARTMGMRVYQQDGQSVGVVGSGAIVENPELIEGGSDITADTTFRMAYANILEDGGTIRPVKCEFLAIPIGDALTNAGVARFSAQQLRDGQTNYEGSVIIKGIIFGLSQTKTRSQMTPLFVLKKSVDIPAKHYLSISAEQASEEVGNVMATEIEKGLNKK